MTEEHLVFTETERTLDRFNMVLRARHSLMVDEVRKVAAAIHELAEAIQNKQRKETRP